MKKLRVAMLAPPWLKIPPAGYGGIEEVLDGLVPELTHQGHQVDLFTIGETPNSQNYKKRYFYEKSEYKYIHRPLYEIITIPFTQVQYCLKQIQADGGYDIIHDHNFYAGPFALYWASSHKDMPPAIHTFHGPPFTKKNTVDRTETFSFWQQISGAKRLYFVGISDALVRAAPPELKKNILPTVYNAVRLEKYKFKTKKEDYFITLARFSKDKGQHIAAELCNELGYELRMAGTVAGISTYQHLALELANPLSPFRSMPDFKYYSDNVLPIAVMRKRIKFVGNVAGKHKQQFISNAKALLFPIQWDEPFGLAVIEALACGTPVVAMKRGAMPEIIEHGVNGFLAHDVKEFKHFMQRVDEIDPKKCRESIEKHFSAKQMAKQYIERYHTVIELDKKLNGSV